VRRFWKTGSLGLVVTGFLTLAVVSSGQDAGISTAKTPYVRTGSEVTLSGTIFLRGKRPRPRIIDMSADPVCEEVSSDFQTEDVVGHRNSLANVVVFVKSETLDKYLFDKPTSPAVIQHQGCRYVPHVLGLRTGQELMIRNSDPATHNTHPNPKKNDEWNQSQPPGAAPIIKSFNQSEIFPLKDNQHPWERAYIAVFNHPFFAVSDEFGNYRIENLPAGRYTVTAWHERFGESAVEITLVPGEARDVSFEFEVGRESPKKK